MSKEPNSNKGRKAFELPANAKVDWNKPNGEIGKMFDVTAGTILNYRKRHNIASLKKGRQAGTILATKAVRQVKRTVKASKAKVIRTASFVDELASTVINKVMEGLRNRLAA